jgi:glycosyltransferase involved in cell wall biosynthesis
LTNPAPNFTDMKLSPERDDAKFSFLYVGQIEDHKGVPFLVRTFVNFWEPFWTSSAEKKEKLSVELMIVGSGSRSADVEKIAYGDKRIKVFGAKTHSEVKEIMQSADCLIVPSLCYENSPTVIHEAAFLGLPVIAARIGGISELVHETGGILFDPGSEEDLVEKMKYVLENRSRLKDIRIKERKFNRGDYIEDLIKLF